MQVLGQAPPIILASYLRHRQGSTEVLTLKNPGPDVHGSNTQCLGDEVSNITKKQYENLDNYMITR